MNYLIIIEKGENNYGAYSPDVLGCVATGKTIEKTIASMKEALEFHLADLTEVPEAKGLLYHFEDGLQEELNDSNLITIINLNKAFYFKKMLTT